VRRTRAQLLTQLSGGGELSGPFEVEEASRVARLDCD
jgi:hypothetical protein